MIFSNLSFDNGVPGCVRNDPDVEEIATTSYYGQPEGIPIDCHPVTSPSSFLSADKIIKINLKFRYNRASFTFLLSDCC